MEVTDSESLALGNRTCCPHLRANGRGEVPSRASSSSVIEARGLELYAVGSTGMVEDALMKEEARREVVAANDKQKAEDGVSGCIAVSGRHRLTERGLPE